MTTSHPEWIWHDGDWVHWEEATVHVTAHALHYGSSAFEGIRAYDTRRGPAIFRLPEHIVRFFDSAKLLRMNLGNLDPRRMTDLCLEIVARNRHKSCYIRPLAFRGSGAMGLNPMGNPTVVSILSFEWGRYLGSEAIEQGIDAGVSSWRRFSPGSAMPRGKIGGQYVSNSLVSVEAANNGYQEGIMLDHSGVVSEGAGENLFLVLDGELITPPLGSSILAGITRNSVLQLAADQGLTVHQEVVTRDMLYLCDELFMTGTAAEITPVRSVDQIPVGDGRPGPITQLLQQEFFGIVEGEKEDRHGWLMPVPRLETTVA
jgi:branched-chain amino acid aminotransferase